MLGRNKSAGLRIPPTLILALVMASFTLCKYYGQSSINDITGETQHISMSPEQEIVMGQQSAPQMAREMGDFSRNQQATAIVKHVGEKIVRNSAAARTPYQYAFHLLGDQQTINAFALPGGQIFITEGLLFRLSKDGQNLSEDMLAGVLAHEVGHVVARHSAERLAKWNWHRASRGLLPWLLMTPLTPRANA